MLHDRHLMPVDVQTISLATPWHVHRTALGGEGSCCGCAEMACSNSFDGDIDTFAPTTVPLPLDTNACGMTRRFRSPSQDQFHRRVAGNQLLAESMIDHSILPCTEAGKAVPPNNTTAIVTLISPRRRAMESSDAESSLGLGVISRSEPRTKCSASPGFLDLLTRDKRPPMSAHCHALPHGLAAHNTGVAPYPRV